MSNTDTETDANDTGVPGLPASRKKPGVDLPPPVGTSNAEYNAYPETDGFISRFDPAKNPKFNSLPGILEDNEKARGAAEKSIYDPLSKKLEERQKQHERAFAAEGAALDSIPPEWNADQQMRDRIRSPLEDFGSLGSVFGILASQFTKNPDGFGHERRSVRHDGDAQ